MSTQKSLSLLEVQQLELGGFLKQEESEPEQETEPEPIQKRTSKHPDYECQNPKCLYITQQDDIKSLHLFEIDGDNTIVICNCCYDMGYRFCLFTHDILHIDKLELVLGDMYAQPDYNQGQLDPERLKHMSNLYQYLKMIGIENPDPRHSIIKL